jgi:agmatine/peptidylarginine deiminase
MEGGALEIDETGYLLSTQSCLAQAQRNQQASFTDYQNMFAQYLGANNNHFFKYGYLQGDDTDGHIDNLVRFTPDQGLVVQACFNRELDEHFPELQALLKECEQHFPQHHISPLPLPQVYNQQRQRLPASYANYLINNEQILMPIYQQPEDKLAIDILQQAYPNYSIKPINALPLVQQFGSIHCSSMQVPKCTLKKAVLEQFKLGVTIWQV